MHLAGSEQGLANFNRFFNIKTEGTADLCGFFSICLQNLGDSVGFAGRKAGKMFLIPNHIPILQAFVQNMLADLTQMVVGMGQATKIGEIMSHFTQTKEVNKIFTRLALKEQPLQLPEYVSVGLTVEMGMHKLGKAEIRK